jgi:hypothetical protein
MFNKYAISSKIKMQQQLTYVVRSKLNNNKITQSFLLNLTNHKINSPLSRKMKRSNEENDEVTGTDQSSSMPNSRGGEEDMERQAVAATSTNERVEHIQNNVDHSYPQVNQDGLNLISSLVYQQNNNNNNNNMHGDSQQFLFHHDVFPSQLTTTSAPASNERMDESARERRLAQNRRTAQARRDRNKAYLETLQQTHNDLLQYNKILLEDNAALKIHHANLLTQVNDIIATKMIADPNATGGMNLQQQENQTLNPLSLLLQNLNNNQSSSQIDLATVLSSFASNNSNDQDSQLHQQLQNQMTSTTETNRGDQTRNNLPQNFLLGNAMINQVPTIPLQSDQTNQRLVGGESNRSNYAALHQQPDTATPGSMFDDYVQATSILSRLHHQQQQLQRQHNASISSMNQLHQLQVGESPWVQNLVQSSAAAIAASAATSTSESSSSALRATQNQDQIIQNQSNNNMTSETSLNSNNAANPLSLFLSGNLPRSPTKRQKKE